MALRVGIGLILLSVACTAQASTYVVRPDGSGGFPTIQAAVDAAVSGDVVELASGVFTGPGNRNIQIIGKALAIRSQSGDPATCIVDCESISRGLHMISGYGGMALQGITIARGLSDRGAGLRCEQPLNGPFVTDCIFLQNSSTGTGGGVSAPGRPTFLRCKFIENSSSWAGGAFGAGGMTGVEVSPAFEDCWFAGNTAAGGGAIDLEVVQPLRQTTIQNCVFTGNTSTTVGAAISLAGPTLSSMIDRCTFLGNSCFGIGGVIDVTATSTTVATHSIIAFSMAGMAISCPGGADVSVACCDIYGNAGGDWVGCIAGQEGVAGNLYADPLFCDSARQDYSLSSDSPCAEEHNLICGRIGVFGIGCSPTPTSPLSWGRVKTLFRGHDAVR